MEIVFDIAKEKPAIDLYRNVAVDQIVGTNSPNLSTKILWKQGISAKKIRNITTHKEHVKCKDHKLLACH